MKLSNKLPSHSKRLLTISIIVVALAIMQSFLWNFVANTAADLHQKRSRKQQIAELQQKIVVHEANASSQKEFLDQLDVALPLKIALPQTVERLERLAQEQQVSLQINSIEETSADALAESELDGILPVRINVQVAGSPAELLRYLEAVEHVQELTVVEQWSLTANADASASTPAPLAEVLVAAATYRLTAAITFFLRI